MSTNYFASTMIEAQEKNEFFSDTKTSISTTISVNEICKKIGSNWNAIAVDCEDVATDLTNKSYHNYDWAKWLSPICW